MHGPLALSPLVEIFSMHLARAGGVCSNTVLSESAGGFLSLSRYACDRHVDLAMAVILYVLAVYSHLWTFEGLFLQPFLFEYVVYCPGPMQCRVFTCIRQCTRACTSALLMMTSAL